MKTTYRALLLLALPVLLFGAGMLTAGVVSRAVSLIAPEPVTLLDAVADKNDEAMLRMVSAGDDPGLPDVLRLSMFHWHRGETTSPLLVAIGGGDINIVSYLTKHTARIADAPNDQALCIAARYGHSSVARYMMAKGVPAVPKAGCGTQRRPEDVAKEFGSHGLADVLRAYRLERQGRAD